MEVTSVKKAVTKASGKAKATPKGKGTGKGKSAAVKEAVTKKKKSAVQQLFTDDEDDEEAEEKRVKHYDDKIVQENFADEVLQNDMYVQNSLSFLCLIARSFV